MIGEAFLDDYAFTIIGLLDLYEATFETTWLTEAKTRSECSGWFVPDSCRMRSSCCTIMAGQIQRTTKRSHS